MDAPLPPIWFYVPAHALHDRPPESLRAYRAWVNAAYYRRHFAGVGKFNWILQTHLHLAAAGFPSRLVHQLPDEGIVVTHRHFLSDDLRPGPRHYLVCVLADKEEPGDVGRHRFAQAHLVQNPRDPLTAPSDLWFGRYLPFWTQIDLIPRAPERGDRFERIGFFGIETNLARELRHSEWRERVRARSMTFTIVPRPLWHDYSETDVVVGIRGFSGASYHYKPATKLHNAWRAGVPAVMGLDSACAAERMSELDYLEAATPAALEAALDRLAASPELRRQMSANGSARAAEVSDALITERWREFLVEEGTPAYRAWLALGAGERAAFFERRERA